MAGECDGTTLGSVRDLFDGGTLVGLDDTHLLDRFLAARDGPADRAFEVLVRRHGPMVLRVCRQTLRDGHDAEDAYQATFLILARGARSIRRRDALACWLFGVARKVSRRARAAADRRQAADRRAAALRRVYPQPPHEADDFEALYQEIDRLPRRYREPIVLCDLDGLTYEAAARQLDCPLGTLSARINRARARLRAGLTRRGVGDPGIPLTVGWLAATPPPAALVAKTVRAMTSGVVGRSVVAGTVTATIEGLAKRTMATMRFQKLFLGAVSLSFGALGLGVVVLATSGRPVEPPAGQPPDPLRSVPPKAPTAPPDAAALVRSVREQEAWIDRVDSLWLKADYIEERTPAGIAKERRELQEQFPRANIDANPNLQPRGEGQTELAFDRKRLRAWNRYSWGIEDTRVWDRKRYLGGSVDAKNPRTNGFLIAPKPGGDLNTSLYFFASFQAGPHPYWWISTKDQTLNAQFSAKPEDFVAVGRDRFDETECDVYCAWGSWDRFYIADGRLRGIKTGCQTRPDLLVS